MTDAAALARPAAPVDSRAAAGGSAARTSRSSSSSLMVAAFMAIPLYVVIVTSFKPLPEITLGRIFALPAAVDARALGQGLEHALHRARLRRHQDRASGTR